MPRTGKGGARTGTVGKTYGNRTDLNQAVKVAPNQPYGQGVQQAQAQKAVPLPNNAGQLAALNSAAANPAPSPMPGPATAAVPIPGDHGDFGRPTDMPGQPVTTGLPFGPGAGPESLSGGARQQNMTQQLAQLAGMTGNPDIQMLAARAQAQRTQ